MPANISGGRVDLGALILVRRITAQDWILRTMMMQSAWYLPLSEELAKALSNGASFDSTQSRHDELGALLFLLQLPKLAARPQPPLELERLFARLLTQPTSLLSSVLNDSYSKSALIQGLLFASSIGVGLMDQDAIDQRQYVHADGTWNFDFSRAYGRPPRALQHVHHRASGKILRLSSPQQQLVETLRANPGDSIETQAYAGSGKTFLLKEILAIQQEQLHQQKCLFLADVESKLWPVKDRFSEKKIHARTFAQLASLMLARGNAALAEKIKQAGNRQFSAESVVERLSVSALGTLSATWIVHAAVSAINRFCLSSDGEIGVRHLPMNIQAILPAAQQSLLSAVAQKLWGAMIDLQRVDLAIPVTPWHRLKQIALLGLEIPPTYQIVIIDEGHDLIRPVVEILDRSPQVVITLGDQFQNLQGRHVSHAASIRHREMNLSLRSGPQLCDYLNQLIDIFPDARVEPFAGNADKETIIREYPAAQFPSAPCAILVADEWGAFDWLIRNRYQDKGAAIAYEPSLGSFMNDCLSLYTGLAHPKHHRLAAYRNWADLRARMDWNHAFVRVEEWLEKVGCKFGVSGLYNGAEPHELGRGIPSRPLIVTVASAKNFELPRVAISEDLYYFSDLRGKQAMSKKLALLYTAITRCSGQIFFPDTHHDWVACILKARQ